MPQPDFTQDMISFLDNSFQEINNNAAEHSKKYSGASLLNPNMINQYRYQKDFNPMTFNPFDESNHDRWVAKETWGTALAKGFDGFATRFGNTFVEYWKDYGRMADALINWDLDKMLPSESEMYAQYYKDQQDMFKNKVFVPYGEEDGIFNKSGISEFVSNAGFAMGTYGAFATELLVDMAITALTAGAGAGTIGATVARFGAKLGVKSAAKSGAKLGLKYVDDFFKGAFKVGHMDDIAKITTKTASKVDNMAKAGKNLTNMSNASKAIIGDGFDMITYNIRNILKSKSAGEFFLNVGKGMPLIGSGVRQAERIVKAGKAGYSTATMVGMGVRGIQRMANEFNMSSTESVFEAVMAYGETLDFMLKDYHNRHGEGPNELDFSLMQDNVLKAATANYRTNLVILLATNKIQFGTLFNKFPMHKSWLTRQIINEAGEGIVGVTGKKGVLKVFDTKNLFGGVKTVAKIGKEFGWKKASWEAAKLFRKDFLKFEVTEGVQEIIQETSNIAWKNYYAAQYAGAEKTITDAFGEGLGEQWSKQGLKVFIHGAMTGGVIRLPTRIIGATLEQSQKYANDRQYGKENNPIRQAEAQRKKDIETVNAAAWTADYNKSSVSQLVNTLKSSIHMDEAVKANNEFEWNNGKDNMMIQAAIAANRLGIDNAYTKAIEHMADDMTVDEFNKVMGINLDDTKYKTPQEYAKSIAKQVGLYSETVTKVRKEFENLVNPIAFAPESMNQYAAIITRAKQEEAIEMIAMMRIKGDRNTDRIKSLKEEISKLPGLESSSQYAFNILTSVKGSESELGEIQNRILTIKESLKLQTLTASEKAKYEEQLKDLQEREADIKTWQSFFTTNSEGQEVFIGETITEEETGKVLQHDTESKKVKDLFRKIINSKNKEDGLSEISEKAFQESSIKLSDIIKLTNQTKSLMDSYNSLYNAEKFQEVVKRMHEGHIKFIVSNNLEYYIQVMDRNILRYLAKKYNISESELAKERELIAGTNYNLNPNEEMNYMFQLDTIYQLMEKNPQMKEDYKNFREQLNLQLENNKAYQELISLIVDPSKFEEDIKKIEDLLKQVGDVIVAFDVTILSETDPTFAKQDVAIEVTPDTITSDDIIRIAAKLNKGMELAENEADLYRNEKVKDLVEKQREKLKDIDLSIKDDKPDVIEQKLLDDEIISDEDYDKSETTTKGVKIATDVNPEARRRLNNMDYSNSQINNLSREEREKILTNGIPVEEYFKASKKADIERRRQEEVSFYSEGVDTEIKVGGIGEDRIAYSINVNEKVDVADNELGVFNTISLSQEESDKLKNMKNIAGVVNTLKFDDSYIKDAYEIGFTNVFDSQRGKGIGEKAIKNIGENLSKNGYTLVSDDSRSDAAEKMWARLESKGLAKKIPSKIQVKFGDIEIDGLDERARYIYQYVPINAKYDAEYVNAVKKGEMTKEQAIQSLEEVGRKDSDAYTEIAALTSNTTSQQKADLSIGKIPNTNYEVKSDGVYWQGKKLDNPDNLSHRQLIEADIKRRNQKELKRITLDELKKELKRHTAQLIPIEDKIGNSFRIIDASDGELTIDYIKQDGTSSNFSIKVSEEILDKYRNVEWSDEDINAKYNAELKALESSEIQEKETPLNDDLFSVQSVEELNITYARKKAEQIIEELPKELLSSIENIEDAKLYLQNIILERLVKYTGKDISSIKDKRSTNTIDRIVSKIKQEFFDLMDQEKPTVEIETVPDSNITNVNVLSTEGIIEQVQQNTAILVESTEKILANSKKSSNFVATEETILNVLKEIKNFKC